VSSYPGRPNFKVIKFLVVDTIIFVSKVVSYHCEKSGDFLTHYLKMHHYSQVCPLWLCLVLKCIGEKESLFLLVWQG